MGLAVLDGEGDRPGHKLVRMRLDVAATGEAAGAQAMMELPASRVVRSILFVRNRLRMDSDYPVTRRYAMGRSSVSLAKTAANTPKRVSVHVPR